MSDPQHFKKAWGYLRVLIWHKYETQKIPQGWTPLDGPPHNVEQILESAQHPPDMSEAWWEAPENVRLACKPMFKACMACVKKGNNQSHD